jgi:shikimate dehydrogenase
MRLYLLGRGIQHSQSPGMWNGVFQRLGLDWHYGLLDVEEDGLRDALELLEDPQVLGYNVTMPYKAWAYERSVVRSRDAQRVQGANWLGNRDGQLATDNTDVKGARMLLTAIPPIDRVLVLGAGGTAAAMLTALEGRADRIVVANRTHQRAVELARRTSSWLGPGTVSAIRWEDRMSEAAKASLLVNTTPVGTRDDHSPLEDMQPREGTRIYDAVYRAGPTPLQLQAARWGVPLADGLAHLEAQAVALLPLFGLPSAHAALVRTSLKAASGRDPHRWRVPDPPQAPASRLGGPVPRPR